MRVVKLGALTSIAFAILTGCASTPPTPIYVSALVSAPSGIPGTKRLSSAYSESTFTGNTTIVVPDLFVIRECNAGQCSQGVVKPTITIAVEHVNQTGATVRVVVRGEIGQHQTLKSQTPVSTSEVTRSVATGVPVITDQFSQDREANIPFGQARQIPLPHDLRAQICIARSVNGMPDASCNFMPLQMNESAEASTPSL